MFTIEAYQKSLKESVSLMRADAELMSAWLSEKIAIYGTVDYTFFKWYFETHAKRLRDLESVLDDYE